jgi:pimeloyl-ACP methyl ester carboxylesterase/DNA-binding CsgD family transcriptional regulator
MQQEIRFCTASDGARLAWARHGNGPTLVKASNWLTHLEYDWESPVWRHWLTGLGAQNTLVRYDDRGCGLSDRNPGALSLDRWVQDLETIVDAAGLDRFALLGLSGGSLTAVAYAARHPDRVERLVIYGGYGRGRARRDDRHRARLDALMSVIASGWKDPDPSFRRLFTMQFLPEGTPEQMTWFDELQRRTVEPETAIALTRARSTIDVSDLATSVTVDTLVAHGTGDRVVPFEEGRDLAGRLPHARLLPLESINHILLADEPAWASFITNLRAFVGTAEPEPPPTVPDLSARERDVLELVAAGLDNEAIGQRLYISVRTVERHLSNTYVKLGVSGKSARAAAAAHYVYAATRPGEIG